MYVCSNISIALMVVAVMLLIKTFLIVYASPGRTTLPGASRNPKQKARLLCANRAFEVTS
jgi:hypothetical protein